MNRIPRLVSASVVTFMLGVVGCTPGKEDKPPAPKVTGDAGVKGGSVSTGSLAPKSLPSLPKMGVAPRWKLKDMNGQVVDSEQLKGKVVVLDFWATWCGPCVMEIPGYIQLQKKYGQDGLVIVGASVDEGGPAAVKPFASKHGINYTLVMADDDVVSAFGGVEGIPTTFLIDRSGQIRDRKVGAQHVEQYGAKVAAVMAEKS